MNHEAEIKSLVSEMASIVNTMCYYAVKKTIDHDTLCRCISEDTAEFNRLMKILHEELGYSHWGKEEDTK